MSTDYERLGATIRQRRKDRRLSLSEAARRASVSPTTWRRTENGQNLAVRDETVISMAEALALQPNDLLAMIGRDPYVPEDTAPMTPFQGLIIGTLAVCSICSAVVPEWPEAQKNHERWHAEEK